MLELDQNKFITEYVTVWLAHYDSERHLYGAAAPTEPTPIHAAIIQASQAWCSLLQQGVVSCLRVPERAGGDR